MRLAGLLALALAGCSQTPQSDASELQSQIDGLEDRVTALEEENGNLHEEINGVRLLGLENASNHASLRDTVNSNVKIDTDNILRQATNEGRCGQGWVKRQDGTSVFQNIPCTAKDLWPDKS